MKNKFFAKFDYFLILVVLSLVTLGILFIYSSSVNSEGISVTNEHIKQIIWASIGFVFMVSLTLYDFRKFEKVSIYLYSVNSGTSSCISCVNCRDSNSIGIITKNY